MTTASTESGSPPGARQRRGVPGAESLAGRDGSLARLERLLTLVLAVTAAGGLGLLAGGARPRELLHFVYAVIAVGAVPVAGSLSMQADPRRRGVATLVGALVALVIILRLFGTG